MRELYISHILTLDKAVLQLALAELQTLPTTDHPPHRQMRIIATSLLALNLASITGVGSTHRSCKS